MVKVIMSGSGEGKTKQLLALMEKAAETEIGCMVCIEPKRNMSFNLRHQTRLIDASEFDIGSYEALRGFVCGLYAGNYDISHIFMDDLYKISHSKDEKETEKFLNWLELFSIPRQLAAIITISGDPGTASEALKQFM